MNLKIIVVNKQTLRPYQEKTFFKNLLLRRTAENKLP